MTSWRTAHNRGRSNRTGVRNRRKRYPYSTRSARLLAQVIIDLISLQAADDLEELMIAGIRTGKSSHPPFNTSRMDEVNTKLRSKHMRYTMQEYG